MSDMVEQIVSDLKKSFLFSDLNEEELSLLASMTHRRRFKPGEFLFRFEDKADYAFLVTQGRVSVYRWTPEGDEKKFHNFVVGQVVAEAAMFMHQGVYPMNARADQHCEVLAIPRASLRTLCMHKPQVAFKLIESMGQRMLSLVNRVDQLSSSTVGRRLAGWIADQCRHQAEPVSLQINRRDLALQLGTAPETLSRLLNKYRESGLIDGQRGHFKIMSVEGILELEQMLGSTPKLAGHSGQACPLLCRKA